MIGYRSLELAGPGARLGLYGFGAAAHIVAQVAQVEGRRVYAFTRPGNGAAQALPGGLVVCGRAARRSDRRSSSMPPLFLRRWAPLPPAALASVRKGGTVVLGGIHISTIPAMPYALLWGERVVKSVANLTRRDAQEFLELAGRIPIATEVVAFALADANVALDRLRSGQLTGAAVLVRDGFGDLSFVARRCRMRAPRVAVRTARASDLAVMAIMGTEQRWPAPVQVSIRHTSCGMGIGELPCVNGRSALGWCSAPRLGFAVACLERPVPLALEVATTTSRTMGSSSTTSTVSPAKCASDG